MQEIEHKKKEKAKRETYLDKGLAGLYTTLHANRVTNFK